MSTTLEKQIGGDTENAAPNTVKGCRSFAGMVIFFEHVLSRTAEIVKTYI